MKNITLVSFIGGVSLLLIGCSSPLEIAFDKFKVRNYSLVQREDSVVNNMSIYYEFTEEFIYMRYLNLEGYFYEHLGTAYSAGKYTYDVNWSTQALTKDIYDEIIGELMPFDLPHASMNWFNEDENQEYELQPQHHSDFVLFYKFAYLTHLGIRVSEDDILFQIQFSFGTVEYTYSDFGSITRTMPNFATT
jgi:hypothetical protein